MTLRLLACGPLVGLSMFVALPVLAEDAPGTTTAPAEPVVTAPETGTPAETNAAPVETVAPGDTVAPPETVTPPETDAAPAGEPVGGEATVVAPPAEPAPATGEPPASEPKAGDEQQAAPAEAETPDAAGTANGDEGDLAAPAVSPADFLDEVYLTCVSAIEDSAGAYDIFAAADWAPMPDPDSETAYYRQIDGSKSFAGIGEATLFYSIEVFPSMTVNYCMITLDNAEAAIPVASLIDRQDLNGLVRRDGSLVYSIWEGGGDEPDLFLQVEHDSETGSFVLDATYNAWVNAAQIPSLDHGDGEQN